MSVLTLYADGVVSSSGASVTGAASIPDALLDASDSSYAALAFEGNLRLSLGTDALPAGSVVKRVDANVRGRAVSTSTSPTCSLTTTSGAFLVSNSALLTTSPVSYAGASYLGDLTQGQVDDLNLILANYQAVRWFEANVTVTCVEVPTVTVDLPVAASTVTTTDTPTIEWSPTLDSDGGVQTHFEVWIVDPTDGDRIVEHSGVIASQATAWVSPPLPDGDYVARVAIAQTVNGVQHWSDIETTAFDVTVARPGAASILTVADPDRGTVLLSLDADLGGDATTDWFEVQRTEDGGETWTAIRTTRDDGMIDVLDVEVIDWEAPLDRFLNYRCRGLHEYSGAYAVGEWSLAWVSESELKIDTRSWWLKHPTLEDLNVPVAVHSFPATSRTGRHGVQRPLGRSTPVVVSDVRSTLGGTITLRSDSDDERATLDALLDTLSPMLLQAPAGEHWDDAWIAVTSYITRTRFLDKAFVAETLDSFAFVVVERPDDVLEDWPGGS